MAEKGEEMSERPHIRGATILMSSGGYFDYDNPENSPVMIEDIARGLANTCRFGGQCPQFYSVAEHSVLMARHLFAAHGSSIAYNALMHDAAEALIGDIPKPMKEILPDYQALERRVELFLSTAFQYPRKKGEIVAEWDIRMLAAEQIQVMGNSHEWHHTYGRSPAPVKIEFWSPERACVEFLMTYERLKP